MELAIKVLDDGAVRLKITRSFENEQFTIKQLLKCFLIFSSEKDEELASLFLNKVKKYKLADEETIAQAIEIISNGAFDGTINDFFRLCEATESIIDPLIIE